MFTSLSLLISFILDKLEIILFINDCCFLDILICIGSFLLAGVISHY